jgi:acetoacetyl-CoA synthetase
VKEPLWKPSDERIARANLTRFMQAVGQRRGLPFDNYSDLYHWSITDIKAFWEAIWREADIIHSKPYSRVLTDEIMPGANWFESSRLNFAENLLRFRDSHPAIVSWNESGPTQRLTYRQLHDAVTRCAAGLRQLGVVEGDRVAAFLPNIPEAVIGMLATTSIGALWSSCSPDFGLQGVFDRFSQISPRVLIATEGYQYQGKRFSCLDEIRQLSDRIPSIEHVILVTPGGATGTPTDAKTVRWDDLLTRSSAPIEFAQFPFDHPIYIMYSSGTTGAPKCIVHGAGGTLLQHWKELALHTDLRREDVISYYTTCGWMMWNWLVSSLMTGATIFLYDGSPAYPNLRILWDAIDAERISVFGTSPKFLSSCRQTGLIPRETNRLDSLRTILSTGSPLTADNFAWVYQSVKKDLQLSSISGGTDIISCFMLGNPLLPVYSEEIQCRGLGLKVEAYDDAGKPVIEQTGELVCTRPFPSMPIYFWSDPDGRKYRSAYFETYPGIWRHGDYIKITERGSVIVYGRSDATLNPGGVRIGTAEIYNPVESMEEIADSLVIGQNWNADIRIVLFVVMADGVELSDDLKARIRERIRIQYTPRHVPAIILRIGEVPRTLNGKKVEMAVTKIIHGQEVTNRDALANPDSLRQFENLPGLA